MLHRTGFAAEWDIDVVSLPFLAPDTATDRGNQPADSASIEGGAEGRTGAGTGISTEVGSWVGAESSEGQPLISGAEEGSDTGAASLGEGTKVHNDSVMSAVAAATAAAQNGCRQEVAATEAGKPVRRAEEQFSVSLQNSGASHS
eukprot:1160247-Pelagomonas_calceolata.AAC.30